MRDRTCCATCIYLGSYVPDIKKMYCAKYDLWSNIYEDDYICLGDMDEVIFSRNVASGLVNAVVSEIQLTLF